MAGLPYTQGGSPPQAPPSHWLAGVPFRAVVGFTAVQLTGLAGVWALVTFAGVAGVVFPVPIVSAARAGFGGGEEARGTTGLPQGRTDAACQMGC